MEDVDVVRAVGGEQLLAVWSPGDAGHSPHLVSELRDGEPGHQTSEAGGVGLVPGGLSPELSPVEYPDLGVAAAHSDLIGEERVETDGGDGLVTADEDILTTEICRTPGLLSQVEPADGPVLPSGEEGVGVPGDGDGLVDRPHVAVELTVGGVGLPQQVGVEEGPVPGTAHDLLVAGLGQELGREDVGSVRGEDLVNFPADTQSVPFRGESLGLTCSCKDW